MGFKTDELTATDISVLGNFYAPALTQAQTAYFVYYNPTTKQLTYDVSTGGGGGGTGDVGVVGTPAVGQVAVWVQDASIEGTSQLTYSLGSLNLGIGTNDSGQITSSGINLIQYLDTAGVVYLADLAMTIEPTATNQLTVNPTTFLAMEVDGSVQINGNLDTTGNLNVNTIGGYTGTGLITFDASIKLPDNSNISLGTGSDWEIYFTGTDLYLDRNALGGNDIKFTAATAVKFTFDMTGAIGTATDWSSTSDERLKEALVPYKSVLDKISSLQNSLVHFKWKETGVEDVGFIAQEIEPVFPEFINTDDSSLHLKGISYGKLSTVALEGIAELREEKDAEIVSLNNKIANLEKLVQQLIDNK